jgi:hypothetical protein
VLAAGLAWVLAFALAFATVAMVAMLGARLLARRVDARDDPPVARAGLPPRFRALLDDASTLRRVLETPVARLRAPLRDYDVSLVDARMALWSFVRSIDALSATERAWLAALGLRSDQLRATMFAPGVLERTPDPYGDTLLPDRPDRPRVARALGETIARLRSFEGALAAWRPSPYR